MSRICTSSTWCKNVRKLMMPCLHNFNVELKLTIHGVFNYLWKLSKNFSRLILSISNFRQYFSANSAQWKIVCVCVCVCGCVWVCVWRKRGVGVTQHSTLLVLWFISFNYIENWILKYAKKKKKCYNYKIPLERQTGDGDNYQGVLPSY